MIIASSGCATTTKTTQGVSQTIGSDSIRAFTENPSGTSLPFIPGDTISFSTKETIIVSSRKVNWVRMVVKDVNTSRIRGEVVAVIEDDVEGDEEEKEGIEGHIVEVKLEDIESILVWDLMTIKEEDLAGLEIVLNIISLVTIFFLVSSGIL
jgi:hypothetical protein